MCSPRTLAVALGLAWAAVCAWPGESTSALRVTRLRCEYRVNPVGLDVAAPRLSWVLEGDGRGLRQTAYHVLVAASPEALAAGRGDLWDSGQVASDATIHVEYAGRPLQSRMAAHWKVRVWDQDGRVTAWSEPAAWTMGLLDHADWQARWIADAASVETNQARRPHNGYHSAFVGSADTRQRVTLDLGQARRFAALRLWPARPYDWQPDTPGFLFPLRFQLEVADLADFADARVVLDQTAADVPNPGANAWLARCEPATARHVRLTVTRLRERDAGQFAFALAELELLDGETNAAAGAVVRGLDTIESGGWARTNLVDGVTQTVPPGAGPGALPATLVRKSFTVEGPVRRATAYASALGLYEFRLNGRRVGDDLLAPEWTSYRRRVQYQVHDVTALLQPGTNAVAALLGEGWYAGRLMAMPRFPYGNAPRFLLQLEIELADGRTNLVVSDASWRGTTDGPIRAAGIYDGETHDARRELPGWDTATFDDAGWSPVRTFSLAVGPRLVWQRNKPIRVTRELTPLAVTQPKPGVFVFDLGQNMVGWCRLRAAGRAGQTVTLRHAEMLNDDGTLYTANLRGAPQVDRFTPAADGPFTFEPRFTYHGFRFVEVTGLAAPPGTDALLGRVFHSAAPEVGRFECSEPALNQLLQNILWTQRGNLMSTPNDCPQRDERFGWMGDIQAFAQTASFNMDLAAFFTKFAQDIRDDQADDGRFPDFAPHPGDPNVNFSGAPAWADAGVIVPWRAWQNYADTRLLAEHFAAARRWVEYVHARNPDLIWATNRHNDYNDWLNGDWIKQAGWPTQGGSVPKEVFATAFFAHSADLVSRMAERTGRPDEARRYGELFERIRAAFNRRFVQPDGRIAGDTQGGYALALHFDLLPETLRPLAARHLVENIARYQNHLSTGIQTTHRAMLELARWNQTDLAWLLLTNRTFPSWRYMMDNGATTIWERWDGYVKGRGFQDAGMNSFNHWAFGAVGEWMWRHIAGLNPDDARPGWKHFTLEPRPGGGVTWARAEYESIRGRIASAWRLDNGVFQLEVTIPPNTTATVVLPAETAEAITESGRPLREAGHVKLLRLADRRAWLAVDSGTYRFKTETRP
jgi:alpha-L-rhamnosidase